MLDWRDFTPGACFGYWVYEEHEKGQTLICGYKIIMTRCLLTERQDVAQIIKWKSKYNIGLH